MPAAEPSPLPAAALSSSPLSSPLEDDEWQCERCTLINATRWKKCRACHKNRPATTEERAEKAARPPRELAKLCDTKGNGQKFKAASQIYRWQPPPIYKLFVGANKQ